MYLAYSCRNLGKKFKPSIVHALIAAVIILTAMRWALVVWTGPETTADRLKSLPWVPHSTTLFQIMTNTTDITQTTKLMYDNSYTLEKSMEILRQVNMHLTDHEWSLMLEARIPLAKAWRRSSDELKNLTLSSPLDWRNHPISVAPDLSLGAAVKARTALKSWALLESLRYSLIMPKEVILVTGLNGKESSEEIVPVLAALEMLSVYYSQEVDSRHRQAMPQLQWYVYQSNVVGAMASRWLAAMKSSSEFVCLHDNDDWLTPDSLLLRLTYLKQQPEVDAILANAKLVELNDSSLPVLLDKFKDFTFPASIIDYEIDSNSMVEAAEFEESLSFAKVKASKFVTTFDWQFSYQTTVVHSWPSLQRNLKLGTVTGWNSFGSATNTWVRYVTDVLMRRSVKQQYRPMRKKDEIVLTIQEQADYDWMMQEVESKRMPSFVWGCHNGWIFTRRSVFENVPMPVKWEAGEDALLNQILSTIGLRLVCMDAFRAGLYLRWTSEAFRALYQS